VSGRTILFDLDGTLTNSAPGIIGSLKKALARLGYPEPAPDLLRRFIGPPMFGSLEKFCKMSPAEADEAVRVYRGIYNRTGVYENEVYPGIPDLLDRLRESGAKLAVATTKPAFATAKVLEHFALSPRFDFVSAADESERESNKKGLILTALRALDCPPERAVMVGDTKFDAEGARDAGTDFIGVLYGFGTRGEMEREGARRFAPDVFTLGGMLIDKA
jgi:phosphoglycolate phosphatase